MAKALSTRKKKKSPVKPGLYNAMLTGMTIDDNGVVTATLKLNGKGFTVIERYTSKPTPETIPEKGQYKFFIACNKYRVYTAIGADNRHHASNKATKLFGPMWSFLGQDVDAIKGYDFVEVKDFASFLTN